MNKIKVGVLGATGMVGQRFLSLLENHPWFEVTVLAASDKSAGQPYEEALSGRWRVSPDIPKKFRHLTVKGLNLLEHSDAQLFFSGLPAEYATDVEANLAKMGRVVVSNAKNHRFTDHVPLLIPEVNADHLEAITLQQKKNHGGFIVTNPNCTITGVSMAMKALMHFGLSKAMIFSMQAISGAGYPGVPSLDMLDNLIPFISGEEDKAEVEPLKILGSYHNQSFVNAKIKISAHCNRVAVSDGHTCCVSISLDSQPALKDIQQAFHDFKGEPQNLRLPSAPEQPIIFRHESDRPQPKLDRLQGDGMSVSVGRLRPCALLGYKFTVLSHNTIRGAAGAAILNAELLMAKNLLGNLTS